MEAMVLAAPERPSREGNMVILGMRGEERIAVCDGCSCDIPLAGVGWWQCRCGRYKCNDCDLSECSLCPRPRWTRATVREAVRHREVTEGWGWPPSQDPPTEEVTGTMTEPISYDTRGRGEHLDQPIAAPAVPPLMVCRACGSGSDCLPTGSTWRICNCGSTYCQWCLDAGCWDCPVLNFFDPHDHDQEAPEVDAQHGTVAETWDGPPEALGLVPCRITPGEALERRRRALIDHRRQLNERRADSRALRSTMIREGNRPRRERRPPRDVTFTLANVNCVDRLYEEVQSGTCFRRSDYLLVQETRTRGEEAGRARRRCRELGWDAIGGEAYLKDKRAGGGTMILARGDGLRPLAEEEGEFRGRLTLGICSDLHGTVVGSCYGFSGLKVAEQMRLWCHLSRRLVALGRPFVVGADWQVDPDEPAVRRFAESLDAAVLHPGTATNTISQSRIDFYIASKSLLGAGWTVTVDHSCAFSPHVAVVLRLGLSRNKETSVRLAQPKVLPIEPPVGPLPPRSEEVDWDGWTADLDNRPNLAVRDLGEAVTSWAAGAEVELFDALGIQADERIHYLGIGEDTRVVSCSGGGRFREVADEMGLTGQRLDWAVRGARLLSAAAAATPGSEDQGRRLDVCRRIACRAAAFLREARRRTPRDAEKSYHDTTVYLLTALARSRLWRHGRPPLLTRLIIGASSEVKQQLDQLVDVGASTFEQFAQWRRRIAVRARRKFATEADLRTAHRVSRCNEFISRRSASADKAHEGEASDQRAADMGMVEWAPAWKGADADHGDQLVRIVDDLYALGRTERDADEVLLEPLDDDLLLKRVASKFKGNTGTGQDWLRPRHVAWLSRGARRALLAIYRKIEGLRRWPILLRSVVEVALGKKGGGARLIGQATALYRIWAKLRFIDVRRAMESRLARPYLPAAPGRGALQAAYDVSFDAETARSKGMVSASTCFDLKQYYEQVEVEEVARGCRRHGLPQVVAALTLHMYLGPRRIRVGQAVSKVVFPRRSILAGCTFALVIIRLISIDPVENLMTMIKGRLAGWEAYVRLTLYVDDGIVSTYGSVDAVAFLHAFITKLVLNWVAQVLRKEVATHKLVCIAASAPLVARLNVGLGDCGITATTEGEILGVDFAAGGPLRRRRAQIKRRRKAMDRRRRLRWWRASGGSHVKDVAKGGLIPAASYSDPVVGITNAALRDYRRIHAAAATVQCAGASLTAKLAIGGNNFGEYDPAILYCNPPLFPLLRKLWEQPSSRCDFSRCWWQARADIGDRPTSELWSRSCGPVMATWLHFRRTGIDWIKPFKIKVLDHQLDLLGTPPRQVVAVVAAHARRHYDRMLIDRLCKEHGWDEVAVGEQYRHGINWDLVRTMLQGKGVGGPLKPDQRRGLELLISGGFWTERRRWAAGIWPAPSCAACGCEMQDDAHRTIDCDAMHYDATMARAAGLLPRLPEHVREAGLAPLLTRGLPPKPLPWEPVGETLEEGDLDPEPQCDIYGDGSGFLQTTRELRRASWGVVRVEGDGAEGWRQANAMRGGVAGWFSTVPRGEILALIAFLRRSGPRARYITDCQSVFDAARMGVPDSLISAGCINADLWCRVRAGLRDREEAPVIIKTKAHRSRAAARRDEIDHEGHWVGNDLADRCAKDLARAMAENPPLEARWGDACESAAMALRRLAFGVAWALGRWPVLERKTKPDPRGNQLDDQDAGHILRRRPDGAVECALCRRVARTSKGGGRLRREVCGGSIIQHIDETHALRHSCGVTWCANCGGYTSRWPRTLLLPCKRKPWSATRRNVLRRLLLGLPPTPADHHQRAIVDGGAPALGLDFAGEAAWSGGGPAKGDARAADPHSTFNQLVSAHGEKAAPPPTGTYGRLPVYRRGGPPAAGAEETHLTPPPNVLVNAASPEANSSRGARACDAKGLWSSRLRAAADRRGDGCHVCERLTITCCRGCGERLCMNCAKDMRPCARADLRGDQAGEEVANDHHRDLAPSPIDGNLTSGASAGDVQPARVDQDGAQLDNRGVRRDIDVQSEPGVIDQPASRSELLRMLARQSQRLQDSSRPNFFDSQPGGRQRPQLHGAKLAGVAGRSHGFRERDGSGSHHLSGNFINVPMRSEPGLARAARAEPSSDRDGDRSRRSFSQPAHAKPDDGSGQPFSSRRQMILELSRLGARAVVDRQPRGCDDDDADHGLFGATGGTPFDRTDDGHHHLHHRHACLSSFSPAPADGGRESSAACKDDGVAAASAAAVSPCSVFLVHEGSAVVLDAVCNRNVAAEEEDLSKLAPNWVRRLD